MRAQQKQVRILAAIGVVLIAAVFICAGLMVRQRGQVFENRGKATVPAEQTAPQFYPVNINTATAAQLQTVPGIGEKTAQHILDYRAAHGAFRSKEELLQVEGIGEKTYEKIKTYLSCS